MASLLPGNPSGASRSALFPRPSRLRRAGLITIGAMGALGVACGGGGDKPADAAQVWLDSDAANGRVNLDDVHQAYQDAYDSAKGFNAAAFEKRVNEIYEGDHLVMVEAIQHTDRVEINGWEDLNEDKQVQADQDDKLFTITQELKDGGNYSTQGHGANGYYYNSSPFNGFLTGLLIANLFSGGPRYYTPIPQYDTVRQQRDSYRAGSGYSSQVSRNRSYGSNVSSRFGDAATTQSVSPARSSYQSRQTTSGAFRSTASGRSSSSSRSIGSGIRSGSSGSNSPGTSRGGSGSKSSSGSSSGGGSSGSGGISGGGGLLRL